MHQPMIIGQNMAVRSYEQLIILGGFYICQIVLKKLQSYY